VVQATTYHHPPSYILMAFDPAKLSYLEVFWRDHQTWLEECGYMLRPRYRPGWQPSWISNKKDTYFLCEDGQIPTLISTMLDATRISDDVYVMLKMIKPSVHPYEVDIATYLSSEPLKSEPTNHSVPVYEVLKVPDVEDRVILVMPLLRWYDRPRFQTVGESVDFFQQIFEGLQFMHKHLVAHRDCNGLNIMMDGSMYPNSWHPSRDYMKRDFSGEAKHRTRTQRPPKYYLIDFGISRRFNPDDPSPKAVPILGGDKTVPEFQKSAEACDPFPTDVYYIGNTIRQDFIKKRVGFGFMEALVDDMVQDDPSKRPTMDQVVERFGHIRKDLSGLKLRARLASRDEGPLAAMFRDLLHFRQRVQYMVTGLPAVPSR
jgi:hypothetical protein